ncbi:MAG TPA: class I SAM-dependent methyltransferase [Candidatus Acidoferrum sp.]|nr:class I SAM-dependent methyltransferase [Candidatus Acidoferrum sp.]
MRAGCAGGRGSYFADFASDSKAVEILRRDVAPLRSAVVDQPSLPATNASHLNQVLELLRTLMQYRSAEVRHRLEKVGREASMLHLDVLLLIYHFARFGAGNVLEIGPYIGGSTIAATFGARDSGTRKKIITIEAGGSAKHFRLSSRNIVKDLRKNLARFGVAEDVILINGRSSDDAIISEVRHRLNSGDVGLFIFDADNNVRRDLDCYGDLLNDGCWVVIDDYFGPAKAAPIRAQVDALVSEGRLLPFGYYGWGTWVGQWQPK